jgi:hypothetical protein
MKSEYVNTGLCVLALLGIALVAVITVTADPGGPTSSTVLGSSSRNTSQVAPQQVNAQGGNVTEINIQTITITKSWQGYYGNVSGMIALQDASNSTFYNWSQTSYSGRVFATRDATVAWGTVNCTNGTNRTNEETYLGQVFSDSDSVTNTYNRTTHPAFAVGTRSILANTCFSTNGYVANNSQTANYTMVMLSPEDGSPIYTAIMNKSVVGFDGRRHDFELLVAENEKVGSIGVTTYYFWTEFN